jgi:hypothetical protein
MKDKENDTESNFKESINDISTGNDDVSDRVNDPHWLIHELNEILQKGMFKDG